MSRTGLCMKHSLLILQLGQLRHISSDFIGTSQTVLPRR